MTDYRVERDSMGEVRLPVDAYYGATTQRAVENFPISGRTLPVELIHALARVKRACAVANHTLGKLTRGRAPLTEVQVQAVLDACDDVAAGMFDDEFPVDVFQTGSGTSTNMNMNEVIANRAIERSGEDRFAIEKSIHPNDHVNMGQSTNDIFPTAIHVAVAMEIRERLIPSLREMTRVLREKAEAWESILKIGRTHLADATPLSLGQEFSGFARQIELSVERAERAILAVLELPVGGTAVGTGINTHPDHGRLVAEELARCTGIPFVEAVNHFEANAQRDGIVEVNALLKTIAVTLMGVANNLRWLGSGPRCGFHEIRFADLQPGSSIMPGKVNPVLCETLMQVAARVIGNEQSVSMGGAIGGNFQLNIMMPLLADVTLESIRLLSSTVTTFTEKALVTLEPNVKACGETIEKSLAMVTGLNPYIGYLKAAALAKDAYHTGRTIRELCEESRILSPSQLLTALDPQRMIHPHADDHVPDRPQM
ncbi:MAG: class II fumarate hydratase [Planctomycetia bacterium]|nr:class II fumarate hydratase [Planctomycetia bacterium]